MLAQILPRAAARHGQKIALVTDARTLTYADLDMLSDRVAVALVARQVTPGDRVSIYAQNRWEWIVSYHGILKAGAVVNPINVMLTPEEIRYVLDDCDARAILCAAGKAPAVLKVAKTVPCVEHVVSFGDAPNGALSFEELIATPVPPLTAPGPKPTDLERIERHAATLFEGVPTMYMTMLAHPDLGRFDLSSLTLHGGRPDDRRQFYARLGGAVSRVVLKKEVA